MKPEFSKPFDVEHARAGAPFCCRDGRTASILKWDGRRPGEPLIGFQSDSDIPASWAIDGAYESGFGSEVDLVMLPLCLIDGKPVFVGDEVEYETFTGWGRATVSAEWREFGKCRWPAPAKVYPQTTMSLEDLMSIWRPELTTHDGVIAVANAVLRHAIDTGQVVQVSKGNDERDRKLAVAVRSACLEVSANFNHAGMSLPEAFFKCRGAISALTLSDIIATIK